MTREEEIKNAINMYAPSVWDFGGGETISFSTDESKIASISFTKGAKWADSNPKNPWISVEDDLPCNHDDMYNMLGTLIYTDNVLSLSDNKLVIAYMLFNDNTGEWKWNKPLNVKYWMPISKPPKE